MDFAALAILVVAATLPAVKNALREILFVIVPLFQTPG